MCMSLPPAVASGLGDVLAGKCFRYFSGPRSSQSGQLTSVKLGPQMILMLSPQKYGVRNPDWPPLEVRDNNTFLMRSG
jgi:hypothetical protein